MNEVKMIVGIAGCGKTSVAKKILDGENVFIRLSRDEQGGRTADLVPKMVACLEEGHSVFLDNTHLSPEKRVDFIEEAHRLGVHVEAIFVDTPIAEAQVNAVMRLIAMGIDPMDNDAIKAADCPNAFNAAVQYVHKKQLVPPTMEEGFDEVITVKFQRKPQDPAVYTQKALILDYDGTLRVTKSGAKFPIDPDDIEILPGRSEILRRYEDEGYILLGASNQSGVAKGLLSWETAVECFFRTNELLGTDINEFLFCPHPAGPIRCFCRKPMPGIGIILIERYHLDKAQTIMVGDRTSDRTFAQRCGIQYVEANTFFHNASAV